MSFVFYIFVLADKVVIVWAEYSISVASVKAEIRRVQISYKSKDCSSNPVVCFSLMGQYADINGPRVSTRGTSSFP
jgi:hypothetical protein